MKKSNWDRQLSSYKRSELLKGIHPNVSPSYAKAKDSIDDQSQQQKCSRGIKDSRNNPEQEPQSRYNQPKLGKCFHCGQQGHISNECPQQRKIALVKDGQGTDQVDNTETEDEVKYIEGDEGDQLSCISKSLVNSKNIDMSLKDTVLYKLYC